MKAVLLISHGSRSSKTVEEVQILLERLRKKAHVPILEYAFLELAEPSIPNGIDICVQKGATEIIILLNFLNAGMHVNKDIPEIIEDARQKYPDVAMRITHPVGQHERILDLFIDMI